MKILEGTNTLASEKGDSMFIGFPAGAVPSALRTSSMGSSRCPSLRKSSGIKFINSLRA
jgi:hypothetical protein